MEGMERLEVTITILLVVLVAVCIYIAASWTVWRRKWKEEGLLDGDSYDLDSGVYRRFSKGLVPEAEEGVPKITITPVQPRPDITQVPTGMMSEEEEEEESELQQDVDLGRLYFALQYDQHRSVLQVRLIRGEDIPMDRNISGTYVGVDLLPISLQSDVIEPHDTSINVSFRECYEFPLTQSELALQTLDFHICRYDRFSRKTTVGDVFLALAELGAQGIDITREVYLCRNIISSRKAYHARKRKRLLPVVDGEEEREEEHEVKRGTMVSRTSEGGFDPKELWKILRAAVRKGRFRGAAAGPDTPLYQWESMFSPDEQQIQQYYLPTAPSHPGGIFYFSGPGPPEEEAEDKSEGGGEDVVTKGKRSGSFLFPSSSEREGDGTDLSSDQESQQTSSPLQISPAPEEYYTLVPVTPFTPVSPLTFHKPCEPAVSWQVPETFTSCGPDVVQALADSYSDPRIVKSANLRPYQKQTGPSVYSKLHYRTIPQATAAALAPRRGARAKAEMHSRITKRKRGDVRRLSSHTIKGDRKATPTKQQKVKMSPRREPDGQQSEEGTGSTGSKGKRKRVMSKAHRQTSTQSVKPRAEHKRTRKDAEDKSETISSIREQSVSQHVTRDSAEIKSDWGLIFEAKDFQTPVISPLNSRTQSDPNIGPRDLYDRSSRRSVSMTNVQEYQLDSDVSSDCEGLEF